MSASTNVSRLGRELARNKFVDVVALLVTEGYTKIPGNAVLRSARV